MRAYMQDKAGIALALFFALIAILFLYLGSSQTSFEFDGGCGQQMSPYLKQSTNKNAQITYCENGNKDKKTIVSNYFETKRKIQLTYSGYPTQEGISVYVESRDGIISKIVLDDAAGQWRSAYFSLPSNMTGLPVRLVVEDASAEDFNWIGVESIKTSYGFNLNKMAIIVFICSIFFIFLNFLSNLISKKISKNENFIIVLIFNIGILGYISFIAFYYSRITGIIFCLFCIFISMYFYFNKKYSIKSGHNVFNARFANPVIAYTLFVVLIGLYPYAYDGLTSEIPANRFLNLPSDNWIPKIFADNVWKGKINSPMLGDWLSSDRPPLLTGLYLPFKAFDNDNTLYQVVSTLAQSLIFLPLFYFLRNQPKLFTSTVIILLGFSSLFIVNSLFVWPKLLSAAFVITFFILLIAPQGLIIKRPIWIVLTSGAAAFAMLSHGAAVFALIGVGLVYLIKERWRAIQAGWPLLPVALLIYSPWMLYQRFVDPPGDRLLKWHLAGMVPVNDLSLSQALRHAYSTLTFDAWVDGRVQNLKVIFGSPLVFLQDVAFLFQNPSNLELQKAILARSFFELFYSLWFFSPVIAIILWFVFAGWRKKMPAEIGWLGLAGFFSAVVWALLMFVPGSTIVHQGSYFIPVAFFVFSAGLVWHASKYVFFALAFLNSALFMQSYVYDGLWKQNGELGLAYLLIATISMLTFVISCFSLPAGDLQNTPVAKKSADH